MLHKAFSSPLWRHKSVLRRPIHLFTFALKLLTFRKIQTSWVRSWVRSELINTAKQKQPIKGFYCTTATIFTNQLCFWASLSYCLVPCSLSAPCNTCNSIMDVGAVATTAALWAELRRLFCILFCPLDVNSHRKQLFPAVWRQCASWNGTAVCEYANILCFRGSNQRAQTPVSD